MPVTTGLRMGPQKLLMGGPQDPTEACRFPREGLRLQQTTGTSDAIRTLHPHELHVHECECLYTHMHVHLCQILRSEQ